MAVRFSNNFSTLLAGSISSSSTTIPLQGVVGFPTLGPDDRTYLTIDSGGSPPTIEVVKVTAVNLATSEVTVVRGQDGTSASAFSSGAVVELRLTAALLNDAAAVQYSDIGTDPNQVPLNQYLGSMAYQDLDAVSITGGTVVVDGLTVDTDTLHVDAANNRVGIGTTSPNVALEVAGTTRVATGMQFEASGARRIISTHSPAGALRLRGGTSDLDGA